MKILNSIVIDPKYCTTRLLTKDKPDIINEFENSFEAHLISRLDEERKNEGGLRTKGYFKKTFIDKPLISIVTVVFNGEELLEKTMQSVINQTYDNVEYIIIDGGSIDGTLDIIKKYENQIDYWISEQDSGIYDAMNKSLQLVSGEYVNFMNVGDSFLENIFLHIAKDIILHNNPDYIYGDAINIVENGESEYYKKARSHKMIWYGMFTHHQAMFYKKAIIDKYKINYRLQYKIAADYAFTYEILSKSQNILYINQIICKYQLGGISVIHDNVNLSDQDDIRKSILSFPSYKIVLIRFLHKLKSIYNWIGVKR